MVPDGEGVSVGVLQSKRDATRYQILVELAERQPAVSQQEVADAIGVTAQAVSDYLQELVEEGYVHKHRRGRYEVTKEGIDWLLSRTDQLRSVVQRVSEDVLGEVEIETAVATSEIGEGQTVSLTMDEGVLRAIPGDAGDATAVAVTAAKTDEPVGVTNVEGVLDYDLGRVTLVSIPRVQDGGVESVDLAELRDLAAEHDRVAVAGTEALVAAEAADLEADIRFGSPQAVQEAAMKGLSVLVLSRPDELSAHTGLLREQNIAYEVLDANVE
jgi:putative transcriptional regulator